MDLTDLVVQHLPSKRKSSATGQYINCPMCTTMGESRNDTKFRGGFTKTPGGGFVYHCYNCHYATGWELNGRVSKNLMKFLTRLGIDSRKVPIGLRLLRQNEKVTSAKIDDDKYNVEVEFETEELPKGSLSFEAWAEEDDPPVGFYEAFEYLASRGEPVFDGWKYFWTPSKQFSWNQRVLIPFYHHRKMVGYTGRLFTKNEKVPKYYSRQPEDYLFNQDKLESDIETIILVEGILDAISIKGIATLGNTLTPKQINLLNISKKRIILVPDRNKAGRTLLDQVIDQGWEVSIPDWDRGVDDCAAATEKYGRLYILESIYKAAMTNKMKIKIQFEATRI